MFTSLLVDNQKGVLQCTDFEPEGWLINGKSVQV